MSTSVLRETDGAVATLTLNRPDRLNTITPELVEDLRAALAEAQADDAVRVIRLGAPAARSAPATTSTGAPRSMRDSRGRPAVGPDGRPGD